MPPGGTQVLTDCWPEKSFLTLCWLEASPLDPLSWGFLHKVSHNLIPDSPQSKLGEGKRKREGRGKEGERERTRDGDRENP